MRLMYALEFIDLNVTNVAFLRLDATTHAAGGGLMVCFYLYHYFQKLINVFTLLLV